MVDTPLVEYEISSVGGDPSDIRNITGIVSQIAPATATLTSVSASTTSVSLLSTNSARKGFLFYNDSNSTCFIAFAATATTSAFTRALAANDFWDCRLPDYTGVISGIWTVANGAMRITELT